MTLAEEIEELVRNNDISISLGKRLIEKAEAEKEQAGNERLIDAINRVAEQIAELNFRIDRHERYNTGF